MKIRKLMSFFLFLILSVQILPLQLIAAWLSSGQITEEIEHSVNPVKAKSGPDESDPLFVCHTSSSGIHSILALSLVNHHSDETIYVRHADDILTPPPND